jgi:hypothetical protein
VLHLIDRITEHRPTSMTETEAVWGPYSEALAPNAWKLTVNKVGENSYDYVLEAKDKTLGDEAFIAVITGSHQRGDDENVGSGNFSLLWDNAATLPEHDQNVGRADITYSRTAEGVVTIAAEFVQVRDGDGRADFSYRYNKSAGQGGSFEFLTMKDIHTDPAKAALEKHTVKSRWNEHGEGRADFQLSGGDLPAEGATGNECWSSTFASVYLNASWAGGVLYGDEATDCAFSPAEYSQL